MNVLFPSLSIIDFITDVGLLYLASEAQILEFTIVLSLSIICLYLLSYSCGVKLFFIRGTLNTQNQHGLINSDATTPCNSYTCTMFF